MILYSIRRHVSKHVWDRSGKIMGRVYDYRISKRRLSGLIMNSERDAFYSPWISYDGTFYCDCQGYEGSDNICSHILALLKKADFEGDDVSPFVNGLNKVPNEVEDMKYETQLKCYDDLFGGLRTGQISGVVSAPEVGKSLLIATLAVDMMKNHGKNALVIDTEGGFTAEWLEGIAERYGLEEFDVVNIKWRVKVERRGGTAEQLVPMTNEPKYLKKEDGTRGKMTRKSTFDYKKFKLPKETDKPTVYIYNARHAVQIYPFFGRPQMMRIKGGVIEPTEYGAMTSIWDSPVGMLVDKRNIGFVALDSISTPMESLFTGGQINFRTRGKAQSVLFGRAQDLVDEYPVVFMTTVHATINHANEYAKPQHTGGKSILHNVKWVAYLEKYEGKAVAKAAGLNFRNLRAMYVYRHPMKTPWEDKTYCQTTGQGIQDFDRSAYVND